MEKSMRQVEHFMRTFKPEEIKDHVAVEPDNAEFRMRLLQEEVDELVQAIKDRDIIEIADALSDIQYVLNGTYYAFGLHEYKESLFDEVHRSNMTKTNILREDGKIMKGPNFEPPRIKEILEKQRINNG